MSGTASLGRAIRATAKSLFSTIDWVTEPIPGPRILIYHQIGAGHGKQMDLPLELFRKQLDWLGQNGRIVSLAEALSRRSEPQSMSLYVLTFDDGYEDMFVRGFPLLAERVLPFVLYLATDPVESGRQLAPDRRATPVTWDQVNKMRETGLVTLGAHTHRHIDLRRASANQIEDELLTSNRLIEARTGSVPHHFAYPWGYWSSRADGLVRQVYESAVLGGRKDIGPDTDPYLLHRLPIQQSDGLLFFRAKIRRGQRTEELVRRLLSGYRGPDSS